MGSHVLVINLHELFDIDVVIFALIGFVHLVDEAIDSLLSELCLSLLIDNLLLHLVNFIFSFLHIVFKVIKCL